MVRTASLVLAIVALAAFAEDASELLHFDIPQATGNIKIDGKGDDAAWADVAPITAFNLWRTLEEPRVKNSVKICYDDDHIYLLYELEDPDVFTLYHKRDSNLWEGDCAELFIGPVEDSPIYYEFQFAPDATIFDARFVNDGSGNFRRWIRWNCDLKVKTQVHGTMDYWEDTDEGYTVEVSIPREAFAETVGDAPLKGQTWRFAAVRMEYSKTLEREEGYITANCIDGNFHNRAEWYYLTFK